MSEYGQWKEDDKESLKLMAEHLYKNGPALDYYVLYRAKERIEHLEREREPEKANTSKGARWDAAQERFFVITKKQLRIAELEASIERACSREGACIMTNGDSCVCQILTEAEDE